MASVGKEIVDRLRQFTEALENGDDISKQFTCRKVQLDLQPKRYTPEMVKETRRMLGISQGLFAQLLGVSRKTVSAWEQGTNVPNDMASRFMDEIHEAPKHFLKRIRQSAVIK